jgi:cytochrome b561
MALHWLMLLLIASVYASMALKGLFPKGSASREAMATWHYILGLAVFGLVWVRLTVRLWGPTPALAPAPPAWQHTVAAGMHVALYALMIGVPVLGWLTLSAKGKPVPFFGLALPAFIGAHQDTAQQLKDLHEACGTVGYALIACHAVAALWHHTVMRDNAPQLMLPRHGGEADHPRPARATPAR